MMMNYSCDCDVYDAHAEAVIRKRISQDIQRKYNVAIIFKRATGTGKITRIEGLDEIRREFGPHILEEKLAPIGSPRRDWKQTLLSDGHILLRHGDLETTLAMADHIAEKLIIHAG